MRIIVANSALHMSNASQKLTFLDKVTSNNNYNVGTVISQDFGSSVIQRSRSYDDALVAKQSALHHLTHLISDIKLADIDVTLAAVLLFVEFELIDSGRENWKHHIAGARTVIKILNQSKTMVHATMSPLRSYLLSNCLVYVGHA